MSNSQKCKYNFSNIIGESPQLKKVIAQAKETAKSSSTIIIYGESGCGKELLAQSIHCYSDRCNEPFVAVNCGALPTNLIESELFGYESGSFTGAKKEGSIGKFELANKGTLFLDEIADMSLDMQVVLLRVLQENCITKVGGKNQIDIDVRVIAATNKNLKDEVKKGNFREDLYYRLNVLPLTLPPLKDRLGDIPLLLDYFLKIKSEKLNKPIPTISKILLKKIISYCWPGNIRELENFIENLVALNGSSSYEIDFEECHCLKYDNLGNLLDNFFSENPTDSNETDDIVTPLIVLEQKEIVKALKIFKGNISQASSKLGISRNALYNKMKRYNITYKDR